MTGCFFVLDLISPTNVVMAPPKTTYKRAVMELVARHGIVSFGALKRDLQGEYGLTKGNLISATLKKLASQQQLAKESTTSYRLGEKAGRVNTPKYQDALSEARNDRAGKIASKQAAKNRERIRVAQRLKKAGGLSVLAKRDQKEFNIPM